MEKVKQEGEKGNQLNPIKRRNTMNPEIIIVPIFFLAFVWMVKIISDNRIKRMLIEKGKLDESAKFLSQQQAAANPLSSVKWGLVLIGIGAALLLSQFFPYTFSDEAIFGLISLFAGLGFLIYYFLSKKQAGEGQDRSMM